MLPGYIHMNIDRISRLQNDAILVEWELNTDELLGGRLVRPDTYKAAHYTGIVVLAGPGVEAEIDIGDRILFDQFCNPVRYYDPKKKKRYAIIRERDQGYPFAIIPPRADGSKVKIGGGEPSFDYDA